MIKDWSVGAKSWLVLHWKRVLFFGGGGILALMTLVQVFYPAGKLLPFASIEGVKLSGWSKTDAIAALDSRYDQATIGVYFGASTDAYRTPKSGDIGVDVSNTQRVNQLNYPWYLRLMPGSLLWGHFAVRASDTPTYSRDTTVQAAYIKKELGDSCSVLPKNSSLNVVDNKLSLQKSVNGGTCTVADVTKKLATARFSLKSDVSVTIPVKVVPPAVSNSDAQAMADQVNEGISKGIIVRAGDGTVLIPRDQLIGWLDFTVVDGKLDYAFNVDRAGAYLDTALAAKVAVAPGVTNVSTHDFVETSRQTGLSGQTLDKAGTLVSLKGYVAGTAKEVVAATAAVAPSVTYTRTYSSSNVGLSALMKYYAEAHPGTYGVTLIELSGQYRRASYNGDRSFTTASTYKLFVAYSTLLRVESGTWQWTDQIQGGQDLASCFDDMIVNSDNACGEALLAKVGYTAITNEVHAIGCANTSFMGKDAVKTTPDDLALLLASIQTGQVLGQQSSRNRLIDAMKRNVYRQGIPKGVSAVVADKVGFMDALLHDAAIVYGPSGPYVLTIMTDGSSWANIADLTRQIEALRIQ